MKAKVGSWRYPFLLRFELMTIYLVAALRFVDKTNVGER